MNSSTDKPASDTSTDTDASTGTTGSASGSMGTGSTSGEMMGEATSMTMAELPKAVRDAYMKMPGHANATGEKVSQVKTSQYPVLYKIEGTSGSTQYVHYFTPEGNEIKMSDDKNK